MLQEYLYYVKEPAEQFGFRIIVDKTKNIANTGLPLDIKCGLQTVEQVTEFKYLGSFVQNKQCTLNRMLQFRKQAAEPTVREEITEV